MPKNKKQHLLFNLSKVPQKVISIAQNLHLGGKKVQKLKGKKIQNFVLPQMPPKIMWGVSMTNIWIFGRPNYLTHTATNTAAYKCITVLQHILAFMEGRSSYLQYSQVYTLLSCMLSSLNKVNLLYSSNYTPLLVQITFHLQYTNHLNDELYIHVQTSCKQQWKVNVALDAFIHLEQWPNI